MVSLPPGKVCRYEIGSFSSLIANLSEPPSREIRARAFDSSLLSENSKVARLGLSFLT